MANAPKMTWREKAAVRAAAVAATAAAAAASAATYAVTGAAVGIAAAVKKGVKFIGNATGNTNVAKSPTRKSSPHHKSRSATRRAIKPVGRITPNKAAPQSPSKVAPKFARMLKEHGIKESPKKRRHTHRARKEKRGKKRYTRHHRG